MQSINPLNHTVTTRYNANGNVDRVTNALDVGRGTARTFEYDASNNLVYSKDRNQRERTFGYDLLDRRTGETWVASNPPRSLVWQYDGASNLVLAQDVDSRYTAQYDLLGRSTAVDNTGTPGVTNVVLTPSYNAASERTSLAATRGGLADFRTSYGLDTLGRTTLITQTSQPGGSAVADKRVALGYNSLDQTTSIQRHRDLAGLQLVASSALTYEAGDRLRGLTHTPAVTAARAYTLVQDSGDRLVQHSLPDGASSYGYDRANQLTAANHSFQAAENHSYDGNGNRTDAGYATGLNNELTSDGTYAYTQDNEGNRLTRTKPGEITTYVWDYRNRLTRVYVQAVPAGPIVKDATYRYDVFDRRLGKTVDADGAGPGAAVTARYVYDGSDIVLELGGDGTALTHRYLHGPGVDQVLADEQVSGGGGAGTVYWPLADYQGTVRDLVDASGVLQKHWVYGSFGQRTDTTPGVAVDLIFGYTGREYDAESGLYYYRARYFDSPVGRFLSTDPIDFDGNDPNLYRYTGNGPTNATDPSGLLECDDRTFWATEKLSDVRKKIEDYVNSIIDDARKKYPQGTHDAGRKITQYVYEKLGKNRPGSGIGPGNKISEVTEIEHWLKTELKEGTEKYTWDFKFTRYGKSDVSIFSGAPARLREEYAQHSIAPTINVTGAVGGESLARILMGTDKWGHFFQQGYWYYDLGLNEIASLCLGMWLEGDEGCYKKPFYPDVREKILDVMGGAKEMDLQWVRILKIKYPEEAKFMCPGIFGATSTGVISSADWQANYDGWHFYKALDKDPYGYRFMITRDIRLMRQWNEQTNKNRFIGRIKVNDDLFPTNPDK